MRLINKVIIISILMYPSLGFSLVRLKDVNQVGIDRDTGQIRIEFNDRYNGSDTEISFGRDHVEIMIPDSFIIPVRRVFKASSSKSSVLKMEATQVPGNAVKLSVYFRVPIDVIKNSYKLSNDGSRILLNYDLTEKKVRKEQAALSTPVQAAPAGVKNIEVTKQAEAPAIKKTEHKAGLGSSGGFFWAFVRMIVSLAAVISVLLLSVYVVRKYSKRIPGMSSLSGKSGIKILSTFTLAPGRTLYIIDVLGEKMLIASTKDNVSMLAILGEGDFGEQVDDAFSGAGAVSGLGVNNIRSKIKSELKERLRSIKGV